MSSNENFEEKLESAKAILEKLMDPEISLDESIRAYEQGMNELKSAQEMLEKAQLQIEQIRGASTDPQPE